MAANAGWEEFLQSRLDMEKKGEEVLAWLKETGRRGIVLAGRQETEIPPLLYAKTPQAPAPRHRPSCTAHTLMDALHAVRNSNPGH